MTSPKPREPQRVKDWPEDAAHENGQYENICHLCGRTFTGHKRRVTCKGCVEQRTTNPAASPFSEEPPPATPNTQEWLCLKCEQKYIGPLSDPRCPTCNSVAEEPPDKDLLDAALRWLGILAGPVAGARYNSPAAIQSDNAKAILAHVASLSSQLKRRKDGEIALLSEWADERAGLLATIAEDTESLERLKAEQQDAQIVAGFIVGWWPGLEDALYWPKDADEPESNKVYAAAKRILGRQSDTGDNND